MKEPRVFKNSPAILVVIVLIFVVLIGGMLFGTGFDDSFTVLPVAVFAIFIFGLIFVANSGSVTITDEDITTQNVFGSHTLRWTDIHRVSGRGYEIKLHNYDGDVTVHPSSGLPGFEEVVDIIGAKRPDLFNPLTLGEIRRGWLPFILMGLVMLFLLGLAGVLFFVFLDTPDASPMTMAPLAIFGVLAIVLGVTTFSIPREISLTGDGLVLRYLFNERSIRAGEIRYVQFGFTQSRNGKHYFIALHPLQGRQIRLSSLGVSLPIVYLTLKNWLAANQHRQSSPAQPQSIAPNWSDNSGR